MQYFILPLIAVFAAFFQSSIGLGYAMIFMSIAPFFIPFQVAAVVEVLTVAPICIYIAVKNFKKVKFKIIIVPIIISAIFNLIGVELLMTFDENILRRILGGVLICLSLYNILSKKTITLKPTLTVQLTAGGISGFLSGLCNIGGPPMAIYMLAASEDKEEINASLQFYFLTTIVSVAIIHLFYGNITKAVLEYSLITYIGVLIGTILGRIAFKKISASLMKKLIYLVMIAMGLSLLILG